MDKSFRQRVLEVVRQIPSGHVVSYQEVARRAGSPSAARAVGTIMKLNHDSMVPCHRVIRADGTIGEYNAGKDRKRKLLAKEGVQLDLDKVNKRI